MAQSIYFGGPILTMEEPLYAQALVEEDGVIRLSLIHISEPTRPY